MKSIKKPSLRVMLVLALTFLASLSYAQFYNGMNMEFGKNRVQWKDFHWSYYEQEIFDVYFYQGGNELAKYVIRYANEEIPVLEKRFGHHFSNKIQFLVYNSLGDLKQSNLNNDEEDTGNTGGVTKIIGSKVFLYFNGNYYDFEQQIKEGIAHLLLNQVMNGTSLGSQIKNSYQYDIPEWFQNGLCAYITEDWDSFKEDCLQRGILSGDFKKINQLQDEEATVAGYSFWGFIEEKFGTKAFNDILTLAENSRNVKKALLYVTGVKYKELVDQWYTFYLERHSTLHQRRPDQVMPLRYKKYRTFTEPEISPDGQRIAYVSNDEGRICIWVEDLKTGKKERLYKAGHRSDSWVDTSFPLLAWHPSGSILSFILEEKGQLLLCSMDLGTKEIGKTFLYEFQKITSFSYAHKDRKIVLSASRFGKPDIFIFNLFSNTIEQITDDDYTDLSPVFTWDDRQIVFSSNRTGDRKQFDLFTYDYSGSEAGLRNMTHQQLSSSITPKSFAGNKLFYLNDSCGYFNLCEARFDSAVSHVDTIVHYRYYTISTPLTNYTTSIINYSYNPRTRSFAILLPDSNGQKVYTVPYAQDSPSAQIQQMSPYAQRRALRKKQEEAAAQEKTTERRFRNSYRKPLRKAPYGTVDSTGVIFSNAIPMEPVAGSETALVAKKDTSLRQKNYYTELFADALTSQIDFSYMNYSYQPFSGGGNAIYLNSGFNMFLGSTMTDLMEDHKLDVGLKLNTSLINNEYVLRFRDLSQRIDKSLTLHRYVTDNYLSSIWYYRTFTNEAFYTLSYPFNEILSAKGTLILRNDKRVSLSISDQGLAAPNVMENLGGFRGELVYDNSKKLQTNIYVGARGKFFAEYYQSIKKETRNLIVVGLDYRHYTRIHRNFIWANRLAASSSFGQNKLIYYMGGVDNWILAEFDNETPIDYDQNFTYQTLATNMRGFKQNIRNGNNFVVLNSELRFPVFSYFLNRPINMQFIKNFQLVAFGDVGTAWTGWNPYDPNNSLYTSHYHDGNLDISVTKMKEPIVGGLGFGLRTSILGYFVRGDMAWGIEDGKFNKKPVYYLSFNLDF